MGRARFERLHTVRLEHELQNGHAEICREPDGTRWIKLCVRSPACQREILSALDGTVPVRLENGALELLLPWQEGASLRQWRYERTPALGQRRDACLSLLEQQVELRGKLPPCLTALAARAENLAITDTAVFLQYLPDLSRWEPGMGEAQAVCAVAEVICEILGPEPGGWPRRQCPEELRLLYRRQKERDYTSWGQLQRDVAAIPDELPPAGAVFHSFVRRIRDWLSRHGTHLLRIVAAILLAAALLSLLSAYRRRENGERTIWPGMPRVGDQDLRNGEGGE